MFTKQSGNHFSVFDEIDYFTALKRVSFNIGFGVFEARAYLWMIKRPELIEPSGFFFQPRNEVWKPPCQRCCALCTYRFTPLAC